MADPAAARREQVLAAYVALFNAPPGTREQLRGMVSEQTRFVDPFNELVGLDAIHALLRDFAGRVSSPRFEVLHRAWDGDVCLLRWRMQGRVGLIGDWQVPGVSELHFDSSDRICAHIDHWDAAGHLYERLPVVGALFRWLRRRVAAG